MRLAESLAARRHLYRRALPIMPDIMVVDVARPYAAPSLPFGRYYPIILETEQEIVELEAFLHAERPGLVAPDLLDQRPSCLHTDRIVLGRYDPPSPSWPWLLLCRWPDHYAALVPNPELQFARGRYTIETYDSPEAADHGTEQLLDLLAANCSIDVRSLTPSTVGGCA